MIKIARNFWRILWGVLVLATQSTFGDVRGGYFVNTNSSDKKSVRCRLPLSQRKWRLPLALGILKTRCFKSFATPCHNRGRTFVLRTAEVGYGYEQ